MKKQATTMIDSRLLFHVKNFLQHKKID